MGGTQRQQKGTQSTSDPEIPPSGTESDESADEGQNTPTREPERTTETAAEQREAGEMQMRGDSTRARAEVSLQNLRERAEKRNYDQKTENLIDGINFSESPEDQKERFKALAGVSVILMSLAIHENPNADFSDFSQCRQFTEALSPIHRTEHKAVRKLLELVAHGNSDQTRFFEARWAALATEAQTLAGEIRSLETMEKGKKELEKPGVVSKTVAFVKKHPVISAGIAIAGAIGLYKLFSAISEKLSSPASAAEGKKESGGILKWIVGAGIAIASVFGLGRLLGMEGVKKFFKEKFDWNLDNNRLAKALALIAQGKFSEAREVLWEGVDENVDFHARMAQYITGNMKSKIPVTGKTLFEIREERFDAFIHGFGQTQDDISLWARQYGGDFVSYLGFDSKKKNEEQIVVRKFLQKNETRIKNLFQQNKKEINDDTAVEDVLLALDADIKKTPAGPPGQPAENQESAEPGSIDTVVETEPGKSGVGVDGIAAAEAGERFKGKQHFQEFLKKYEGNWGNAIRNPSEFLDDLFSACNQDGIPVVLAEGGIFLVEKDKEFLFSSCGILWDTAVALVAAPFTDKIGWSDAVGQYLRGAMPFIIIGAVGKGALEALRGKHGQGFFAGAVKGAKKGLLFPVEIPRLHIAAGQRVYRTGRGVAFEVKRWVSAAEAAPEILKNQTKFLGELARQYDHAVGAAENPSLLKRNWYAWYTKDRAVALRDEYLKRFRIVYNDLQRTRRKLGLSFKPEIMEGMLDGDEGRKRLAVFLNEIDSYAFATTRPIEVSGALFKNPDGTARKLGDIKTHADNLRKEIASLPADDASRALKQRELVALDSYLRPTHHSAKLEIQAADFGGLDDAGRASKVLESASHMEALEKGVQARFNAEVDKIVAEAKLNKIPLTDPSITARLENLDSSIVLPFARKKQGALKTLVAEYGRLPNSFKTPLLRSQMKLAIEGASGTLMTRIVKGAKGRAKMMVLMGALMFATDQMIRQNEVDRDFSDIIRELGPETGQLLIDVLPFVGTYSNFYSAFTGLELATPRDVSGTWDRVSNVIWGSVGLAGDAITVLSAIPTGGGSLAANVALRLAKMAKSGSRTAPIVLRMWPRISRTAERMGGWMEFGKKAKDAIGGKTPLVMGLRKIEMVGTVAGTALLAGGVAYHLRYAFMDDETEIELPSDLQAESVPAEPAKQAPAVAQRTAEPEAPAESGNRAEAA